MDLSTKQLMREENIACQQYKQFTKDTLNKVGQPSYQSSLEKEIVAFNKFFTLKEER